MTKLLILLATYNGELWIQTQLDSIFSQSNIDISVVVSDDMSSDSTKQIIKDNFSLNDLVLLEDAGKFGSAGQNFFRLIHDVDFSNYEYIAFADQDDIWNEDKLSVAVNRLIETGADAYSSNVIAFWEDGREQLIDKAQPQREWDFLFQSAGPGCTYVLTNTLAIEIQKVIRGSYMDFQRVYQCDWFIYAYARANHYKWVIDHIPHMHYRQHPNNEVGANIGFNAIKHRYKQVINNVGLSQSKLIAELSGIDQNPFVKMWSSMHFFGIIKLSFQANKCRRKSVERLFFFIMCLILAMKSKIL